MAERKQTVCEFEIVASGREDGSSLFIPRDSKSEKFLAETGLLNINNNEEYKNMKESICDINDFAQIFKKGDDLFADIDGEYEVDDLDELIKNGVIEYMEDDFVQKGFKDDDFEFEEEFLNKLNIDSSDNNHDENLTKGTFMSAASVPRSEGLKFVDDQFETLLNEYNNSDEEYFDSKDKKFDELCLDCDYITRLMSKTTKPKLSEANNITLAEKISILKRNLADGCHSDSESEETIDHELLKMIPPKRTKNNNILDDLETASISQISYKPKVIKSKKRIVVNKRSGLPKEVEIHDNVQDELDSYISNVKSHYSMATIRNKSESREEKKARKSLIKQHRQIRRIEKKTNKEAFQTERIKLQQASVSNRQLGKRIKP